VCLYSLGFAEYLTLRCNSSSLRGLTGSLRFEKEVHFVLAWGTLVLSPDLARLSGNQKHCTQAMEVVRGDMSTLGEILLFVSHKVRFFHHCTAVLILGGSCRRDGKAVQFGEVECLCTR
jgi:hypothetical protein